jgi:hypothetical protein
VRSDLRKVVARAGVLGLPLLAALMFYVVKDPFRVLRDYDFGDYYDQVAPSELNRDYVSLKLFRKYYPSKQFDAFIFGSSRSFPFHCDTWARLVPGARPFHYPAASENIYGIARKLTYLDEQGVHIRHAILEVTLGLAGAGPRSDPTHRLPRELTNDGWLEFQSTFLKGYFTDLYFLRYASYFATGGLNPFNRDVLNERGVVRIDPETNDYFFARSDRELAADPEGYYRSHAAGFPPRDASTGKCDDAVIGDAQRAVLRELRAVLAKQGTDYRVLLTPLYEQPCVSRDDIRALREIFGDAQVFDFTGVNELSAEKTNFYDYGHIRPFVADQVLERMYPR